MSNRLKDQAEEKIEKVSNNTRDKVIETYRRGKDETEKLADEAESNMQYFKESANKLMEEGKKKVGEAQQYLESHTDELIKIVQDKPLLSLLVAGGVGYLLSLMMKK